MGIAFPTTADYVEGGGTMHEIFNYTLEAYNSTFIRLHRRWINDTADSLNLHKGADLYLISPPESKVWFNVTPNSLNTPSPRIDILIPNRGTNSTIQVKVLTNDTSLSGLDPENLFLTPNHDQPIGLETALRRLADEASDAANQVSFLTYTDRFVAGGWRFLTVRFRKVCMRA